MTPSTPTSTRRRLGRRLALAALLALVIVLLFPVLPVALVYTDEPDTSPDVREAMLALCASRQPEGENGWPALAAVLERVQVIHDAAVEREGSRDAGRAAIGAALATPLRDDLRVALAAPRFVRPWSTDGFPMDEFLPLLAAARSIGEAMARSIGDAVEAGDWAAAIDALDLALRLGAVTALQPTFMHLVVGTEVEVEALRAIRAALARGGVPESVAQAIEARVAVLEPLPVEDAIELARLEVVGILQWLHGERGYALPLTTLVAPTIRSGGFVGMEPIDPLRDDRSIWLACVARWSLATHEESVALVDRYGDEMAACSAKPFATRWEEWPSASLGRDLVDVRFAIPCRFLVDQASIVDWRDAVVMERDATVLAAALAAHAAAHGRLPSTLDDLVPDFLDALPGDPISGASFAYAPDDDADRLFTLYGLGPDGVDDGGAFVESARRFRDRYRVGADFDVALMD